MMRKCAREDCDVEFEVHHTHKYQKYHNAKCQSIVYARRRKLGLVRHGRKFANQKEKTKQKIKVKCALDGCEIEFEPRDFRNKFHCDSCREKSKYDKKRAIYRERRNLQCKTETIECASGWCDVRFTPTHALQKFHNKTCMEKNKSEKRKQCRLAHSGKHKRRRKKLNTEEQRLSRNAAARKYRLSHKKEKTEKQKREAVVKMREWRLANPERFRRTARIRARKIKLLRSIESIAIAAEKIINENCIPS